MIFVQQPSFIGIDCIRMDVLEPNISFGALASSWASVRMGTAKRASGTGLSLRVRGNPLLRECCLACRGSADKKSPLIEVDPILWTGIEAC